MSDGTDDGELVLVVEPEALGDTFATGMMPPEDCGDHVRVSVFAERRTLSGDRERRIVCRLVFPKGCFLEAFDVMREAIGPRPPCPRLN